ncbi:PigN-domain-containing protein [Aspergillus japonicus CBS 114.51]|uniref:GPI ethanolamine phosphate transferase 1 n=1 Tax=Aspergillus japonicus CBS 114.51 TaxID=1448312 RepID=A0A8T8WXC4_ASPJA|nr:PigN-domain-containing protein [Aspergillus japonicus CBS 114.51]RAH80314.1 PigN-domain-containing protein [Aspergillus japonicus CBS 114.51]
MARLNRSHFLALAVVFHLLYVYSIFDIYFVSPVVGGMKAHRVQVSPPAQRVVSFVADGLRADKTFQQFPDPSPDAPTDESAQIPRYLAPFLRTRVLEHGTFGVSYTRLYEDVSAVTTGWKLNPVGFDSVLNRSRHAWSWGSPDILPMFAQGAAPDRVDTDMYSADAEDYSKDATELDIWVFDRVKRFFRSATDNPSLETALRQDQNIFFLHLLGLDTSGHSYRPYSREYLHNLQVVDNGVREICDELQAFFGDDRTAFVFTADHGMSDWGSHGDGHPDNTRTPLIAWGAGVARPKAGPPGSVAAGHDGFSADWHLDHVQRHDVAQADIAALMAYLAGDSSTQAEAMLVNALEILEMYRVRESRMMASKLWYVPFPALSHGQGPNQEERIARIRNAIRQGHFRGAIEGSLISVGYLGWMAFALTNALSHFDLPSADNSLKPRRSTVRLTVMGFVSLALLVRLYSQKSPMQYYAYAVFPVLFWAEVWACQDTWTQAIRALSTRISASNVTADVAGVLLLGLLLEAIQQVQSYHDRRIYTLIYILALFWPAIYGIDFIRANRLVCLAWAVQCGAMSIFTLLPAMKTEDTTLITLGGLLMFSCGVLYIIFEPTILQRASLGNVVEIDRLGRLLLMFQVGLVPLAICMTRSAAASLQSREGLPRPTQILGWTILVTSFILPFFALRTRRHHIYQLVVLFFTFAPLFILLTISYEDLFYCCLRGTLFTWVQLESKVSDYHPEQPATPSIARKSPQLRPLRFSDARIALFFLYLSHSAFFSTGNLASISSFSLDAVLRLLPVFDPSSQGALLILKILAPFVLVSANLGLLTRALRLRPGALFVLVVAASDYLTLRFFWCVRDEGSWLEIGESITVFVLASLLCGFVAGLEMVGEGVASSINPHFKPQTTHQKTLDTMIPFQFSLGTSPADTTC